MGNYIPTLVKQPNQSSQSLCPSSAYIQPLQKIKEYHGMFKYICDSFIINAEQFKQIFTSMGAEKARIWDPEGLGRVDALQIFCGLIVFSRGSFRAKLGFLFSIFDFNQIKSLSFIDLEVIVLNICNSVYKVMNKNGKVNSNEIAEWLGNYFHKKQRIKITILYKFCMQNAQVKQFFKQISKNIDDSIQLPISQSEVQSSSQNLKQRQCITSTKPNKLVRPKHIFGYPQLSQKSREQTQLNIQWHRDLISRIVKVEECVIRCDNGNYRKEEQNYGCRISWVYGINTTGDCKPFIPVKNFAHSILYRTGSLAIIHDIQMSTQTIIQGHVEEVSCIAFNQRYQILATVEQTQFPNINLWRRAQQGSSFDPNFDSKTTREGVQFIKYTTLSTNHDKGIRFMQFIAREGLLATVGSREHETPIIIYDFAREQVVHQIIVGSHTDFSMLFTPVIHLELSEVPNWVFDTFLVLCNSSNTIHQITLKHYTNTQTKRICDQQTAHKYPIQVQSSQSSQSLQTITTALSCYLNVKNPYLRSYKDKSIGMAIITGHDNGSVWLLNVGSNKKYRRDQIISGLDGAVTCLQVTSQVLAVSAGSFLYVYQLDILNSRVPPIMIANLKNQQDIDLLSYNLKYFDFIKDYILAMTQNGQFLKLTPKTTPKPQLQEPPKGQKASTPQPLQLQLSLQPTLTKFRPPNIFCLLCPPSLSNHPQLLFFSTTGNKILCIDTLTHEIQDIWEINSVQNIVALDAVCSEEGVCYVVCACQSGRLYIRIDWDQSPKYYDCGSEIVDAKISKDCAYLLVATKNNYLLFFAQVNNNFTSPRKLLFQYQTPCSINFLDNFKFFLVITSAKNSYLIQIPQLKHKKLHKQTEKISISKVNIKYPYISPKKQTSYSNSCIGGSMKFSLLTMRQRDIYFFNSQDALQRGNYTILSPHKCPVRQIAVNDGQTRFYSLGESDNTLIQWEVIDTKYASKKGRKSMEKNLLTEQKEVLSMFEDILDFSTRDSGDYKASLSWQSYYFKGTKLDKINEAIQKYFTNETTKKTTMTKSKSLNSNAQRTKSQQENQQAGQVPSKQLVTCTTLKKKSYQNQNLLKKRPPSISLIAEEVYGFQTRHKSSIYYCNNGQQLLGYSSRFIIHYNLHSHKQTLQQPTPNRITYLLRPPHPFPQSQLLYTVQQPNPKIHMLYKQPIPTTHRQILHLSMYANRNSVLSYGLADTGRYSINVHDYCTGEMLFWGETDVRVSQFLMVGKLDAVSLGQVRVWAGMYPSEVITVASSGCILPNGKDILLGLYEGKFAILSNHNLHYLHNQQKAHQSAIDLIQIRYLDSPISNSHQVNINNLNGNRNYQIISIGRDEKIKIWTSCFEIKMMISFKNKHNLVFLGDGNRQIPYQETVRVKAMDVWGNKILLVLHTGNVVEVELERVKKLDNHTTEQEGNHTSLNMTTQQQIQPSDQSLSLGSISQSPDSSQSQVGHSQQLTYKWKTITQLHTIKNKKSAHRRQCFSVNPVYPIIVSCANDFQIIIRNYETGALVGWLCYQRGKVGSIKFSPRGTLLVVGFDNGCIQLYKVKVYRDQNQKVQRVVLQTSQFFKQYQTNKIYNNNKGNISGNLTTNLNRSTHMNISNYGGHNTTNNLLNISTLSSKQNVNNVTGNTSRSSITGNFSIINIQFSPCCIYFAVSVIYQSDKKSMSHVLLYRQSSSISVMSQHTPNQLKSDYTIATNTNANMPNDNFNAINSHYSGYSNENQPPCYSLIDVIEISVVDGGASSLNEPNTGNSTTGKYTKSVYFMTFMNQTIVANNGSLLNTNIGNSQTNTSSNSSQTNTLSRQPKSNTNLNIKRQQLKLKTQKTQCYLYLLQQHVDSHHIRVNTDNKIKLKVYQIQDKAVYKEDGFWGNPNSTSNPINLFNLKFPYFVNCRSYRRIPNFANATLQYNQLQSLYNYSNTTDQHNSFKNSNNFNTQSQNSQQIKYVYGYGYNEEKHEEENIVSEMLYIGQRDKYRDRNSMIYGDINGKLHIVKTSSLCSWPDQQQIKQSKTPPTSTMALPKTYSSHTSAISRLQMSSDRQYLFVSGTSDSCIVKYRIVYEDQCMDLDSLPYCVSGKDVHEEYVDSTRFYQFLNNIDPIRDQISDIMLDVEDDNNKNVKSTKLEPIRIHGRRAFDKRNNLYQDIHGNLIYTLGPNIIIQNPTNPLAQVHIPVDPNPCTNSPQISAISLNQKYLIATTEQQHSRLFVWDIYSMTCLTEMKLKSFSIVYHVVQSSLYKVVLVYGVNCLYETTMQLVDWENGVVLGGYDMMYSASWRIKDICEITHKDDGYQFVSCGVQHLTFWQYIANTLVCSSFGLNSPQILELCNTSGQQGITFMTVRYSNDMLFTGCQNGYLYIFKKFQLQCYLKVHEDTIRSLVVETELVFTGGVDGRVYVSLVYFDQMDRCGIKIVEEHALPKRDKSKENITNKQSKNMKKTVNNSQISEFYQNSNDCSSNSLLLSQQMIQSIVLSKNSLCKKSQKYKHGTSAVTIVKNLYIGTRSGTILQLTRQFPNESVSTPQNPNNSTLSITDSKLKLFSHISIPSESSQKIALSNGVITPLLHMHDSDTISSLCFDESNPDLFYLLTFSGVLQIWSLRLFKRVYHYKLEQKANRVFCFKEFVIIGCKKSIIAVKIDIEENRIRYIKEMSMQYQGTITDCCLSRICDLFPQNQSSNLPTVSNPDNLSQKQSNMNSKSSLNDGTTSAKNRGSYLVVGLKKSQFNQIVVNEISYDKNSNGYKIVQKFVVNLKYEIQFMDFSRDCRFLLFKDSFEELGMVNLENYKRINTIFVQMGIQWESQGIRISPHGQKIYCSYSRQNKITVIKRLSPKQIIIGDQMGTLRIFDFPYTEERIGELHTQCYTKHMNFIKNIQVHPSEGYLLSTSVYDRSLILWAIVQQEGQEGQKRTTRCNGRDTEKG